MKPILLLSLSIWMGIQSPLSASNLNISHVEFQFPNDTTLTPRVKMNISWENAWHNARNHDAVWLFIKFDLPGGRYHHAQVASEGHQVIDNPLGMAARFETAHNQTGVFLAPDQTHRGKLNWTIEVWLDRAGFSRLSISQMRCRVYGIEMVHIPEGSFTLGDPGEGAMQHQGFYRSDGEGEQGGLYHIRDESAIEVGPEARKLFYQVETPIYQGDQQGPIPAEFPKGFQAFYCMKYELTQGQYAAFLNSISDGQTHHRANFGGRDYYQNRGSIYFDVQKREYAAKSPKRPCNYITWDDAMAYADWAGLRPMTELEFTKACRGPEAPIAKQYPWGTDTKAQLQRGISPEDELVMFNGMDESQLSDETRPVFGASHYWVMDLAGSLWEKVITIGHPAGRAFTGQHGDGRLTGMGFANVEDWPSGFDEGGYGYRGGGYYDHGRNYHGFNPHSPIAWRRFGAWSGGNRSIAYSTRFVRTAVRP